MKKTIKKSVFAQCIAITRRNFYW